MLLKHSVRLYDHLFAQPEPDKVEEGQHFTDFLNPDSLKTLDNCLLEPALADAKIDERYQFERLGYFCLDKDSTQDAITF